MKATCVKIVFIFILLCEFILYDVFGFIANTNGHGQGLSTTSHFQFQLDMVAQPHTFNPFTGQKNHRIKWLVM